MNLETLLSLWAVDFDLVSTYPCNMRALNTSRMTLKFVPISIDGKSQPELRRYFTNLINLRENAEQLCSDYHSLPTYAEMARLIDDGNNSA